MELSPSLPGIRAAVGGADLQDDHFFLTAAREHPEFIAWLDRRVSRVFLNDRFVADPGHRVRIARDLVSEDHFDSAEAEVQAAACALRLPRIRVLAGREGEDGVRSADYVFSSTRELDVEVCLAQESRVSNEIASAAERIEDRLRKQSLPEGLLVTLRVLAIRDPGTKRLTLDSKAEAGFVKVVREAIRKEPWRERRVFVTLGADGCPEVLDYSKGRTGEVASAELQLMERRRTPTISIYKGTLAELPEAERASEAIRRKRSHGQRTGRRPWVVVLNTSSAMLLDLDEIRSGVERQFEESEGLSAVAVQRRSLSTPGWGMSAEDVWFAGFFSVVFTNPNARHPLLPEELELFQERDIQVVPNAPAVRRGGGGTS